MRITLDEWLSERFGHPLFTVEPGDGIDAEAIRDHARGHDAVSYQARVPLERADVAAELDAAGFSAVNVSLTLARGLEPVPAEPRAVEVRAADPAADGAVAEIAERGFAHSRFHLDPAIPGSVADRIKRDWAANSLSGDRGDGMLVAVQGGEPIGFLAAISTEDEGRRARVIDLMAVDPAARDAGVGQALVARFIEESPDAYDEVRVGTQEANAAATRFYTRLGFTQAARASDFHLHVGDTWPRESR